MWRKLSFDLSRYVTTFVRFSSVDLKTKLFEAQFEVILINRLGEVLFLSAVDADGVD